MRFLAHTDVKKENNFTAVCDFYRIARLLSNVQVQCVADYAQTLKLRQDFVCLITVSRLLGDMRLEIDPEITNSYIEKCNLDCDVPLIKREENDCSVVLLWRLRNKQSLIKKIPKLLPTRIVDFENNAKLAIKTPFFSLEIEPLGYNGNSQRPHFYSGGIRHYDLQNLYNCAREQRRQQ
jgi:hypothetical protein